MSETPPPAPAELQIPGTERRAHMRHPCSLETFCQPGEGRLDQFWHRAQARDISAKGLALALPLKFEPGTCLAVELLTSRRDSSRQVQVQVVHARNQTDNVWLHGCILAGPLNEDELQPLLA